MIDIFNVLFKYVYYIGALISIFAGMLSIKSHYDKKIEKLNNKLNELENKYNELHNHYKKIHDCNTKSSEIKDDICNLREKVDKLDGNIWEVKLSIKQLEVIYEIIGDKYGINTTRKKEKR